MKKESIQIEKGKLREKLSDGKNLFEYLLNFWASAE